MRAYMAECPLQGVSLLNPMVGGPELPGNAVEAQQQ